jgi:cellobiose-specific phosphotransferase system component IIC
MNDRARIGYVDVVLAFATFVAFASVSEFIFRIIDMLRQQVDPLTSVLVGLLVPMLLIGLLYSVGVSARR